LGVDEVEYASKKGGRLGFWRETSEDKSLAVAMVHINTGCDNPVER